MELTLFLVLVRVNYPGGSGYEIEREIAAKTRRAAIRAVILMAGIDKTAIAKTSAIEQKNILVVL